MNKAVRTIAMAWLPVFIISGCASCQGNIGNEMKNISFTEYTLEGTGCSWLPLTDGENNGLVIINGKEELEEYIVCEGDNIYPAIDFSRHTLLLARGIEMYGNTPGKIRFGQTDETLYILNVNLRPGISAVITSWTVAIIVNKLNEENKVGLQLQKISND